MLLICFHHHFVFQCLRPLTMFMSCVICKLFVSQTLGGLPLVASFSDMQVVALMVHPTGFHLLQADKSGPSTERSVRVSAASFKRERLRTWRAMCQHRRLCGQLSTGFDVVDKGQHAQAMAFLALAPNGAFLCKRKRKKG